MNAHTLRFQSAAKPLIIQSENGPHSASIDSWRVSELVQFDSPHRPQIEVGNYSLILEKSVETQDEIWKAYGEAVQIADELDVAWCYACGSPFFSMRQRFIAMEAPIGWTGNAREIERSIQMANSAMCVEAVQVVETPPSQSLPFWPLEKVLLVREAILNAPPETRKLIVFHIDAYKFGREKLFSLAKGLELAGSFFGKTRKEINDGLQTEMESLGVETQLSQSIKWLFDMANHRTDVRHAVVPGSKPATLHPAMTAAERCEFETNAERVLRAFIGKQLGIVIVFVNQG